MPRVRLGLLVFSAALVALLLGGGVALRAGAADGSYRHVLDFSEVFGLVVDNYVDEVDEASVLAGAYDGLMAGLDSRGAYLTPAEVEAWKKDAPGPADPGLSILKTGPTIQIIAVAVGSPAAEAKIVPGDQIRRIAGRPARLMSLDQAARALSGPVGSAVELTLIRSRENFKKVDLVVGRAVRSGDPYDLSVSGATAVLRIVDLARAAERDLAETLRTLPERGAERLLIDLRNLTEGTPRDALSMSALFGSAATLRLKDRAGKVVETFGAAKAPAAWNRPLGILVNGATAGGAEAMAVLLRAGSSATLFGESTFGLGAEPRLVGLPDGSGLLLSTLVWETDGGIRWNGDGVTPSRVVRGEGKPGEVEADQLRRTIEEFEKVSSASDGGKAAA